MADTFPRHSTMPLSMLKLTAWFRWDEWVPPDRLLKINDESLTLQKHLQGTNAAAAGGGGGGSKTHKTGASGINKDNANTRTAARKDGTRGTKRAREEVRCVWTTRYSLLDTHTAEF